MKDGKVEDNWLEIALERINTLVPNAGNCLACGKPNLVSLQSHIVAPIVQNPDGGLQLGGVSYPHVMLTCNNCGNTRFFNYVLLSAEEPVLPLETSDE